MASTMTFSIQAPVQVIGVEVLEVFPGGVLGGLIAIGVVS